jgi:hypothetical protein
MEFAFAQFVRIIEIVKFVGFEVKVKVRGKICNIIRGGLGYL